MDSQKTAPHSAMEEPKDSQDLAFEVEEVEAELVTVLVVILRMLADLTSMMLPALRATQAMPKAKALVTGLARQPAAAAAEVRKAKELATDRVLQSPVASAAKLRVKELVKGCAPVPADLVSPAEKSARHSCPRAPS